MLYRHISLLPTRQDISAVTYLQATGRFSVTRMQAADQLQNRVLSAQHTCRGKTFEGIVVSKMRRYAGRE